MTHLIDVLSAQKVLCLSRCVRIRFVVVEIHSYLAFDFFLFLLRLLANKWLCTIQNWPFYVAPMVRLRQLQFFRKRLLLVLLALEDPHSRLVFTFRLIRLDPRFVTCHDVIHIFWSTAIVFFEHFLRPIDTSLFFWAIVKLCEIFFTDKYSWNFECILTQLISKITSISP